MPQRPRIRASDVVFMYAAGDPSQYDAYRGTVVEWGGRARSRAPADAATFRRRVDEAARRGMRYFGSVDFLVDFRGFIEFRPETFLDAACRDLEGHPLRVPWLWDHEYRKIPAYWWCTNHPEYRAYLRDQTERACLAPIDGLHIDDWAGTSACTAYNGGCFCAHCMEAFREHLARIRMPEDREAMGIGPIESFDYGAFLRAKGITADRYRRARGEVPLVDLFQTFQNARILALIEETFAYAESLRGKPLLRSVNSGASSPREMIPVPVIDSFCGEVDHKASGGRPSAHPAFVFRLVEGLGRRQTATASGQDWAWIKANGKPGLVRTWICQAYAFGSTLMCPHHQWCYTQDLGTHWYDGKPEEYAFLYRFVRERAGLLDDRTALADAAIAFVEDDWGVLRDAGRRMIEANIPFAVVPIAGQDPRRFRWAIAGPRAAAAGDLGARFPGAEITRWDGIDRLPVTLRRSVIVEGAERVRVTLRGAPLVCHLLNEDYDAASDRTRPAKVRISIRADLAGEAGEIRTEGMLHQAGRDATRIRMERVGDRIAFEVDGLDLWAMVDLGQGTRGRPDG